MEYLEGVRRVYVKAKIVYADKDVSKELEVESIGESEISHMSQLVWGYTGVLRLVSNGWKCNTR